MPPIAFDGPDAFKKMIALAKPETLDPAASGFSLIY
jgi:hypothetical protein